MTDNSVNNDSNELNQGLYEKLQPLISSIQNPHRRLNLDVLDECIDLSVTVSGWDDISSWRSYLKKYWFEAAVESAIAKAY